MVRAFGGVDVHAVAEDLRLLERIDEHKKMLTAAISKAIQPDAEPTDERGQVRLSSEMAGKVIADEATFQGRLLEARRAGFNGTEDQFRVSNKEWAQGGIDLARTLAREHRTLEARRETGTSLRQLDAWRHGASSGERRVMLDSIIAGQRSQLRTLTAPEPAPRTIQGPLVPLVQLESSAPNVELVKPERRAGESAESYSRRLLDFAVEVGEAATGVDAYIARERAYIDRG